MDLYDRPEFNPLEREYNITATVKVIKGRAKQGLKGGETEYKAVVLIPLDCDETTRFFGAWLPEDSESKMECVSIFGHPIYGGCRMSVHRSNRNYPHGPHLFVMSKGVEDILIHKEGERVSFKVEASLKDAKEFHESDFTDTNLKIDKV